MAETTTTETTRTTTSENRPSLLSSALAIVGFIILLVIIVWGLIHIAELLSPGLSSLFNKTTPPAQIQVSAPASVTSGTPFTVTWKYAPATSGLYGFLYACKSGVSFETTGPNGATNMIPCGAAYTAGTSASSISVTPLLSGTSPTSEPLTVVFIPNSGATVQGSTTTTINPGATSQTTTPSTPIKTTPVVPAKPVVSGPPDLMVRIVSASANSAGLGEFVFDISNMGESSSGTYSFTATLPTSQPGGYTYNSPAQASLTPGAHIVSTLTFTGATPGVATVIVDPQNHVSESNKTNNYASASISMPYSNYNYAPQTTYYQPQTYYTY